MSISTIWFDVIHTLERIKADNTGQFISFEVCLPAYMIDYTYMYCVYICNLSFERYGKARVLRPFQVNILYCIMNMYVLNSLTIFAIPFDFVKTVGLHLCMVFHSTLDLCIFSSSSKIGNRMPFQYVYFFGVLIGTINVIFYLLIKIESKHVNHMCKKVNFVSFHLHADCVSS